MANLSKEGNIQHKLGFAGLLITLGIVFGDIGTSPLYVMKAIIHTGEALDENYVLGALSCIIWTLTLQTTVKYVLVALRADNNGEGGILALYALLRRHRRRWIYIIAIIGASTLLADGIITPAITVTTAIEGLESISPHLPVIPITLTIITIIFFVQRFGTKNIGRSFGIFMLLWFLLLGIAGAISLTSYPQVFKAFNPYYAIRLLVESPHWFLILGAVFLCTTGAEALYSDLGHCDRRNITVSWIFVKVMLILNYLGQGAWVLHHPESAEGTVNPFYSIMPQEILLFSIAMATGAAIVASQALISGSFSILSEAMNLNFWPRMRIKHPTNVKGQSFIPMVNLVMYIGVIFTILLFRDSTHMEAAYGLAITITMLMTTLLLGFYLHMHNIPRILSILFVGGYCVIEGIFLAANLSKFMVGGWFTLLIGGLLCFIMFVWVSANKIRRKHMSSKRLSEYYNIISDIKADESISKYASNLVYVNHADKEGCVDDKLLYSIINKQPKRADHYWLINLEFVDTPDTLEYNCSTLIKGTLFSITMRIGFRIEPRVSLYLRQVVDDLVADGEVELTSSYPSLHKNGIPGDFRFIIIHRIYYPEDSRNRRQNLLMSLYALIRKIGIGEPSALGLDTSVVVVERVPLIIANRAKHIRRIERIKPEKCDNDANIVKGNGLIMVDPIYEELDFLDNGLIKARRNGKYGLLNPLGLECISCDFDEVRRITSHLEGDDDFISATKNGEATIYLLSEYYGYTYAKELFTTPYYVSAVCEEVGVDYRFIARDDGSAFIIDENGEALTSTYRYKSIEYDPDTKTYRGWRAYDNEWEDITLSE